MSSVNSYLEFQKKMKEYQGDKNPRYLYDQIIIWTKLLSTSKIEQERKLYSDYFAYFESIEIDNYLFQPLWYNIHNLIDYDLLKSISRIESIVIVVRDVLWEIIAFKSDRNCKLLDDDNLRALTNREKTSVVFCCDKCGYCEDLEGRKIVSNQNLLPATINQITRYNIHACQW